MVELEVSPKRNELDKFGESLLPSRNPRVYWLFNVGVTGGIFRKSVEGIGSQNFPLDINGMIHGVGNMYGFSFCWWRCNIHITSYHACIPTKLTTNGCVMTNGLLNLFQGQCRIFWSTGRILLGWFILSSIRLWMMIFVSEVSGKLESMQKASSIRQVCYSLLIFWRSLGEF